MAPSVPKTKMNSYLQRINSFFPSTWSERIIIAIVLLMHALFFMSFEKGLEPKDPSNLDESRILASLVSPPAPKLDQPPPAPPTKPKQEEKKKTVEPKPTQSPQTPQNQQQTQAPSQQNKGSDSPLPNLAVAPSTNSSSSGTPIQTDIGKLEVIYQPDADPYYPSFSKRAGEQGEVVVRLIIDETGVVEELAILRSSTFPRLDRAATEIGRRYRFKPYLVNGAPAKISTNLLIKFNLK